MNDGSEAPCMADTDEQIIANCEHRLAQVDPDLLRSMLSRLANLTPEVIYFSETMMRNINEDFPEKTIDDGVKLSPLGQGLLMVACAAEVTMPEVGQSMLATFTGLRHGDQNLGNFTVEVTRLPMKEEE